jgi:hypothetical protein
MEKIFFILAVVVVCKYFISMFLIFKKLKKWSYVLEVTFSIIMLCIASTLEYEWYLIGAAIIGEYLVSKILLYINIVLIKEIAFRRLVKEIHNDISEERYNKLRFLYKIDYGRKLKHGLPAMAKQVHEKTGVEFDRNGFPKFHAYYTVRLKKEDYKASRETHFYKASKILYNKAMKSRRLRKRFTNSELNAFKNGSIPERYTWHHHQKSGKMQLVFRETHSAVNHIGGYSIWGPGE